MDLLANFEALLLIPPLDHRHWSDIISDVLEDYQQDVVEPQSLEESYNNINEGSPFIQKCASSHRATAAWTTKLRRRKLFQGEALQCGVLLIPKKLIEPSPDTLYTPASSFSTLTDVRIPLSFCPAPDAWLNKILHYTSIDIDVVTVPSLHETDLGSISDALCRVESICRTSSSARSESPSVETTSVYENIVKSVLSSQFWATQAFPIDQAYEPSVQRLKLPNRYHSHIGEAEQETYFAIDLQYLHTPLSLVVTLYSSPTPLPIPLPQEGHDKEHSLSHFIKATERLDNKTSIDSMLPNLPLHHRHNIIFPPGSSLSRLLYKLIQDDLKEQETNCVAHESATSGKQSMDPGNSYRNSSHSSQSFPLVAPVTVSNALDIASRCVNHGSVYVEFSHDAQSGCSIEVQSCHMTNATSNVLANFPILLAPGDRHSLLFTLQEWQSFSSDPISWDFFNTKTTTTINDANNVTAQKHDPTTLGLANRCILPLGIRWCVADCPRSCPIWTQHGTELQLPFRTPLEFTVSLIKPIQQTRDRLYFVLVALKITNLGPVDVDLSCYIDDEILLDTESDSCQIKLIALQRDIEIGLVQLRSSKTIELRFCSTLLSLQPMPSIIITDRITKQKFLVQGGQPPAYREIQNVEKKVEVPILCHVDVPTPTYQTVETRKRVEDIVPMTIERPYDIEQEVYDDKIVEIPTPVTILKPVLRREVREMIKEVPKLITKTVERIVEVPEVKYVDKFEEVPEFEYHIKYIPKMKHQRNRSAMRDQYGDYDADHSEFPSSALQPLPEFYIPHAVGREPFLDMHGLPFPGPPFPGPPLSGPPLPGPPLPGPPLPGPPLPGPPLPGPPLPGPPLSGPPLSGPPLSGPPLSGRPLHGAPGPYMPGYSSGSVWPPPYAPVIDIDVPIPVPVPAYYDVPLDIPIERPIPTPVVVGQRTYPRYKEHGEVDVEIFVPDPKYVRTPTPPHLRTKLGDSRITGYHMLHDLSFHPLPAGHPCDIPRALPPTYPLPPFLGAPPAMTPIPTVRTFSNFYSPNPCFPSMPIPLASPISSSYPQPKHSQPIYSPLNNSLPNQHSGKTPPQTSPPNPQGSTENPPFPIPEWRV